MRSADAPVNQRLKVSEGGAGREPYADKRREYVADMFARYTADPLL
jgi:hypothetical protein